MIIAFTVAVEVKHSEGKFASRQDLTDQITSELEGADPGELEGEEGGMYTVESWSVNPQ